MSNIAMQFIDEQFEFVSLIGSSKNQLELIRNIETKELLVKKTLHTTDVIYKIIKDLNSPYFPKIHYIFFDNNETVVIEEYIEGSSPNADSFSMLSYQIQMKLMLKLCNAIKVLHEQGIIHRDLKPNNIIITEASSIRLIDFDAARLKNDVSDTDTRYLGTQGYAPPEQYGFSQTDERSDIYALGQLIATIFGDKAPRAVKKVITKCTEFDPQRRYQSILEVRKALRSAEHAVRNNLLKASAVILLIAISIGTGYTLYQDGKPKLPVGGIAIDINTVPYNWDKNIEAYVGFFTDEEADTYAKEFEWLENGVYQLAPTPEFIEQSVSKGKIVYDLTNNENTAMENVEVFAGLHDVSICSSGDMKKYMMTHSSEITCTEPVYQSLGVGKIEPQQMIRVMIDPNYTEEYGEYASVAVVFSSNGERQFAGVTSLISLIFE